MGRLDLASLGALDNVCSAAIAKLKAIYADAKAISRLETSLEEASILMYFMEIVSLSIDILKGSKCRLREAMLSRRIRILRERMWKASVPDIMPGSVQTLSKAQEYAKMFYKSAKDFDEILDDARRLEEEEEEEEVEEGRKTDGARNEEKIGPASRQALSLVLEIASTRRWLNRVMGSMFVAGDTDGNYSGRGAGNGGGAKKISNGQQTAQGSSQSGAVHAGVLADACLRVWDRCHANGGAILYSKEDLRHELRALDQLVGLETGTHTAGDKIVSIVRECLELKHIRAR